ncbi:DNA translocase FtsK [Duganella zoogloeoides]|uniref:DNA translocase FtsK n=1 Tax=Duganella zoogloeoides TaxID=75659 RepID=A0ABZ0Y830_9BURK|nr:DNA translocase FtsK [Duganella zoogloeoides]WQH07460.1 DNA translocase FtsK [Duganella zoogloeoides]
MARVRERMDEAGGAIEAAIALAKEQATGSTSAQLFLVAAVEIVEPSPLPAAGDEPVREQRVVTSLGADVPAGDGSATDPLYDQAVAVVRTNQRASLSLIQRHLSIGYNRAARLLEAMEGSVVGPIQSNGNRELLSCES